MATRPTGTDADIFKALVEDSSDGIALLDAEGVMRFASRSSERILGYAPEERVGRSAFELVHPEDLTRVGEAFSRCLAEPGTAITSEFRMRHRDGGWREVEATAANRLHHPAVEGIVVTYRDITERRRAEEELRRSETHYRSLVQHAPYGIYQSTVEGRLLDANATFAQMLGYDTVDQVLALNMRDVYERPQEREQLIRRHRGDLGETPPSGVTWRKKDGTRLTVRIKARSVQHAHDGQSCFEGVVEDITERRVLEEQLRQSQKMEAVGRLARGIAHDFNNVLAAILGCAGLLQLRSKPGDAFYEDAEEIARAAERGAELTRQLLAFSRRQAVVPEVLDVHAVLRAFERMLQRLSNGIAITLATPGPAPKVRAERGQIEQIVMNLIVNASDVTPADGSIEIDARIKTLGAQEALRFPDLPPGRYARIAVHDTGTGIEPDAQRHVFEPFFTTKDPSKGTGLGLSIVYGIAKEAGGAVSFTSSAAEGTTFEVLLPLVDDPERAGT